MNDTILMGKRIHFMGIGGIMMASLADMALKAGKTVTGSDRVSSASTKALEEKGAVVYYGQCGENIDMAKPDFVVYTAAIHPDNPEFVRVKELGIPAYSRAEYLGELMYDYTHRVGVSGTHGKSTTTGMLSSIYMAAEVDPTLLCGAELACLDGAAYHAGAKEHLVYESCEYTDSFLSFHPTVAVVLNIDLDHVDYFHSLEQLEQSFCRSAEEADLVVINGDDAGALRAFSNYSKPVVKVGMNCPDAHYRAVNLHFEKGCGVFMLTEGEKELGLIRLSVPGEHNITNALCAAAAALACGIGIEAIQKGLWTFTGAVRRFEKKGSRDGVDVYDDYAHHPTEIRATLETAKKLGYKRVVTVFQSHTYSRTVGLLDDFAKALSLADLVLIAPIFAAREVNITGVSAHDIAEKMTNALAFDTMEETLTALKAQAVQGDLVITMGAGNIYTVGDAYLNDSKL